MVNDTWELRTEKRETRKPGNQESPENLENVETKNYNLPGKKLEFSGVGGRGAWLPLWLLK